MAGKGKRKSASVRAANVLIVILLVLFAYLFAVRGMRFFLIPSGSMRPTLLPNDYVVTLRDRAYERGDVVVQADNSRGNREYNVKRIGALGGDTVRVEGGALFVNGYYVSEPYTAEPMGYSFPELRVPEGRAFLLGDNRNESEDSHTTMTSYPLEDIVGRVRFIYYPYGRFGPFPTGREFFQISQELAVRVE